MTTPNLTRLALRQRASLDQMWEDAKRKIASIWRLCQITHGFHPDGGDEDEVAMHALMRLCVLLVAGECMQWAIERAIERDQRP